MGIYRTIHSAYSAQVCVDNAFDLLETVPEGDPVSLLLAGQYDDDMAFLVIRETQKVIEPGEVFTVEPYIAAVEPYLHRDWLLVAAAQKLGIRLLSQPAWIVIPDES